MRILIVEDNPSDRELLLELLQSRFMQQAKFRIATDLAGAISYLGRRNSSIIPGGVVVDEGPYFSCIVLDLQLPDSTGMATFNAIHDRYPMIPIVIVSHNKDQDLAVKLIQAGAEDFILKDFSDTTDLFRRVLFAVVRRSRQP